jgi:hypothetical protein
MAMPLPTDGIRFTTEERKMSPLARWINAELRKVISAPDVQDRFQILAKNDKDDVEEAPGATVNDSS